MKTSVCVALSVLVFPSALHAHGTTVAPHDLLTAWPIEPVTWMILALSTVLAARGLRVLRARGHERDAGQNVSLFAGLLTLAIALASPVHSLGSTLFTAHMVQHELLMVVAAPLLVIGRPVVPVLLGLGRARRGAAAVLRSVTVRRSLHVITPISVATLFHAVALWAWHVPVLYQASLSSELAHVAQHVSFLGTAVLFWWATLESRTSRRAPALAMGALFLTALHTGLLGALLTFSDIAWYPRYGSAGASWGLTLPEDQQLGGIVMWMPGGMAYVIGGLALCARMLRERPSSRTLPANASVVTVT